MKLRYPVFVFTWWVTGTMAIACYTAAFVWTMEIAAGKYKTYISMSMNYSWPLCRLIIAGTVIVKIEVVPSLALIVRPGLRIP